MIFFIADAPDERLVTVKVVFSISRFVELHLLGGGREGVVSPDVTHFTLYSQELLHTHTHNLMNNGCSFSLHM